MQSVTTKLDKPVFALRGDKILLIGDGYNEHNDCAVRSCDRDASLAAVDESCLLESACR